MGQAQINVRTRACSRTFIARTKQAALTHHVRGKELTLGPARSIRAYSARAELGRICKVACCIIYAERPSQRMEE